MNSYPPHTKAMDSAKIVGRWINSSHELGEVHVFVAPVGGLIEPIMPDTKFRYWGQVIFTGDKPFWRGGLTTTFLVARTRCMRALKRHLRRVGDGVSNSWSRLCVRSDELVANREYVVPDGYSMANCGNLLKCSRAGVPHILKGFERCE